MIAKLNMLLVGFLGMSFDDFVERSLKTMEMPDEEIETRIKLSIEHKDKIETMMLLNERTNRTLKNQSA